MNAKHSPRAIEAGFTVRLAEARDDAAAYEVCLKTGDSGADATAIYEDPRALGNIYVGPYLHLEPNLAHVLEDSQGVCGYALAALNSADFYRAYLERWLPNVRASHPEPTGDSAGWSPTERIYHEYYHPEIYYPESFHGFPSHLHIDLLPRAQGKRQGRRMMETLLYKLTRLGSPGVHLAMSIVNHRAERFYQRLGFHELARVERGSPGTLYLGKRL